MNKPTLLILSVGELGTNVLEAAARSGVFDRIVIAGRDGAKAQARANSTLIGAGLEGHTPRIEGAQLDVNAAQFVRHLRALNPDIIFTTATLMPWWQIDKSTAPKLPFGGYLALHLGVMRRFRDKLAEADLNAIWIGASYPDVVNPILSRTGYGPLCGIGNVQEPIPKILSGLSQKLKLPMDRMTVKLVAQHAFEYPVFSPVVPDELPPHLLYAEAQGKDVTDQAYEALRAPFPFTFDLFFNRVTASAAVEAFRAFTAPGPASLHLPGINGLVGGYPVIVEGNTVRLDLCSDWTEAQAIDVNNRSLPWEGIAEIEPNGTVLFTDAAQQAFAALLGKAVDRMTIDTAADQAQDILKAL